MGPPGQAEAVSFLHLSEPSFEGTVCARKAWGQLGCGICLGERKDGFIHRQEMGAVERELGRGCHESISCSGTHGCSGWKLQGPSPAG